MKSLNEVKARAGKLREVLSDMGHQLKHSDTLEVISKVVGYTDWNTYSAELAKEQQADEDKKNKETTTPPDPLKMPEDNKLLYCSFCGRSQHEVVKLIAGPNAFICNICTDICIGIVLEEQDEHEKEEGTKFAELKGMPNLESLVQKAKDKEN